MNGVAYAQKTRRMMQVSEYCNPMKCQAYASGYCEYDFATGQIMPMIDGCPLMIAESKTTETEVRG